MGTEVEVQNTFEEGKMGQELAPNSHKTVFSAWR